MSYQVLARKWRPQRFDDVIGQPATIHFSSDRGQRSIHGLVSELATQPPQLVSETATWTTPYRLAVVPQLWRMGLKRNCASFRNASSLDIAKQLLQGLDTVEKVSNPPKKRAYVVQHRETDLAFLQRLLADDGIFFFFQQTESIILHDRKLNIGEAYKKM